MAKSVADDPILRNARNFGLIALVFVLIFGIFYYVAGATLISLTSPSLDYTKKFFAKGLIDQVVIIAKSFIITGHIFFIITVKLILLAIMVFC